MVLPDQNNEDSLSDDELDGLDARRLLLCGMDTRGPGEGGAWEPADPEVVSDEIGERYEVLRLIGHGGMGAVYQACDLYLDRLVAIKILPAVLADEPETRSRFSREAKTLAALDHPHIVSIHDYGVTRDLGPYFVMEFVEGRSMQSLADAGELDLPAALRLVSETCAALHYAHSKGVIHRDIKPGNILVTPEGTAKVADFGLALLQGLDVPEVAPSPLTGTGQILGTPSYMAPEQETGQAVDHRSDIYALGATLYTLVTGAPPRGVWAAPSRKAPLDARLDEVVHKALQEMPEARYQAAGDLKADVDAIRNQTGGGPLPPGSKFPPLPSGGAAPGHRRYFPAIVGNVLSSRLRRWLGISLGALLLAAVAGTFLMRANPPAKKSAGKKKVSAAAVEEQGESAPAPATAFTPLALPLPSGPVGRVEVRSPSEFQPLTKTGILALPPEVAALRDVVEVSSAKRHAMALTSSGLVYRWGEIEDQPTPPLPDEMSGRSLPVVQVLAGFSDAVLCSDGSAWIHPHREVCKRLNTDQPIKRLGGVFPFLFGIDDKDRIVYLGPDRSPPELRIPEACAEKRFTEIKASFRSAYALTTTGSIVAWGEDSIGPVILAEEFTAEVLADLVVFVSVEPHGDLHTIVQRSGRFTFAGYNARFYHDAPERIIAFRTIGMVDRGYWGCYLYRSGPRGEEKWRCIEKGTSSRTPFVLRIMNELNPIELATNNIYGGGYDDDSLLMIVAELSAQ